MALNMPNIGNIGHIAEGTKSEFFTHARNHLKHKAHKSQAAHERNINAQRRAAEQHMNETQRMGKMHDAALNADARRTQAQRNATQAYGRTQAAAQRMDAQRTAARNKSTAAQTKAHNARVKSGQAAPGPSAPPRVFAMPTPPHIKAQQAMVTKQRNEAHGPAIREDVQRTAHTQKAQANEAANIGKQRNFAHNLAIKEVNNPAGPIKTLKPPTSQRRVSSSTPSTSPASPPQAQSQPNFPQHQHPQGSSQQVLPSITARQPRTNEFTVGSRHLGGLAAKGSQLEAWANTKTQAVRARNASVAKGGRDRNLANAAKDLENRANKPLSEF